MREVAVRKPIGYNEHGFFIHHALGGVATDRPIHSMLKKTSGRLRLHMPGHGGCLPFGDDARYDTTELPVTDDLYAPGAAITEAETRLARSAGTAASVLTGGGGTVCAHVIMMVYLKPGDTVILPRNAHHSLTSACILGGFHPVYAPCLMDGGGRMMVTEQAFIETVNAHPEAKAVCVTRPDYYGGVMPMNALVPAARRHGMKVLADEAHGAHFNWLPGIGNAGSWGADAFFQSFHKTLPALTGAAAMHFARKEDAVKAREVMRLLYTSSPSFPILKSVDDARAYMDARGEDNIKKLLTKTDAFMLKAAALGYRDERLEDKTRLVLSAGMGGNVLAACLSGLGVDVEAYDHTRIICILPIINPTRVLRAFYNVLRKIPAKTAPASREAFTPLPLPVVRMGVREAYFSPYECVPVTEAVGRIAARSFGLYPPGVPLCVPGEEISQDACVCLQKGEAAVFGTQRDRIACVKESYA